MRVEPFLENPTLYYRLDPGEMGLATPAKASESILRVASHEIANIRRFEAEAALEGGIVVYKKISLDLAFEGSFLAARAGKSEARIIYKKKGNSIVLQKIEQPWENREKVKIDLEKKKRILEEQRYSILKDERLDLSQKEFKLRNIERKIKEIERLLTMLNMGVDVIFDVPAFLNLIA
ncbi:MAG: hypothetical protein H5T71_03905 [Chloroflexi bacterium]|nr:MAG: Uncharacterized protein XD52_1580 [bacterium 42_11]MBC7239228.1 hypothetical protein [Chloroflexota bacterium]MBC7332653.1 hypothetical protein [Synergistota bacterium]MDK2871313.1 hypothetical protein [bacterium]